MSAILTRRGFLAGVTGILAAPAIVRASSIMPVQALPVRPFQHPRWDVFYPDDAPILFQVSPYVRSARAYRRRLTDAQLQALTA